MDGDDVDARLEAIERALGDGETDLTAVAEAAERERELDELRARVDDLESRLTDLDASVQAVRGYVGNVRTVNRDVERRADAALAKVEELQRRGPDRDRPHPDEDAEAARRTTGQSRVDEREDRPSESPGDIARRITGRDGNQRNRRPARDGRGRDGTRGKRGESRGQRQSQDRNGAPTGSGERDDEDGFLSGLRDAL